MTKNYRWFLAAVVVFTTVMQMAAVEAATLEVGKSGYPYNKIQDAINAAGTGDTVLVHDGAYVENINFNNKAITVKSQNGPDITIVDGSNPIDPEKGSVISFNSGEGSDSVLKGFTITGGSGSIIPGEDSSNYYGGGICLWNFSSPTITDCIIEKNTARAGGGIYSFNDCSPIISNSIVRNNSASSGGGGIFCSDSSSPSITNCIVTGNSAGENGSGGGIHLYRSSATVTNCVIKNNSAGSSGGGVVCNRSSSSQITGCIISNNYARAGGGIDFYLGSSSLMTNCVISRNYGGGVSSTMSSPTIINCTISDNSAYTDGGGIYSYPHTISSPTVVNSIFWGNTPNEIAQSYDGIITYSDVQGGDVNNPGQPYPGTGNIDADPMFVNPNNGNYYLKLSSQCIDAGILDGAPLEDREGISRPQGGRIDMGAYEYVDVTSCTPRAYLIASKTTGIDALKVDFDASFSGGSQYNEANFSWDFGDGLHGNGKTVSHTYNYGLYDVSLTVTTECGSHTLTLSDLIFVNSSIPTREVGKSGYPYSSIQDAINDAEDGEFILVHDGTYTENINFNGKAITVKSANGPYLTTIYGNQSGSVVTFESVEDENSVLHGFTVKNGKPINSLNGGGIYCKISHPTITNCIITNNYNYASYGSGVYCYASSPTITNCIISENYGIAYWGWFEFFSFPIIKNCTSSRNIRGIFVYSYSSLTMVNSILWNNGLSKEINLSESSFNATYSNIYGGDPDNPGQPYPGIGNIKTDPLFVHSANGNYHLQFGSPCIDIGTSSNVPSKDIVGTLRPQGLGYDMGAYEYPSGYFGCPHDGDVNDDGSITPQDALMAFQHYLGIITLDDCQQDHANVSGDDSITPADALCIFQKYLGLPSCLD